MDKSAPDLTFENLTYTVENYKGKKTLLNNISGSFASGKLIAILGPSGAGKTTLLNSLSGWSQEKNITGSIKLNDNERHLEDFKSISCYITQDSHLLKVLSVEENLKYAADFKLGQSVSDEKKQHIIMDVADNFGLVEHLKTPTSKLSGGQLKRLAICLELLNDPDIIFLDEPTTGLDSVSTFQCMRYLKELTNKGNTVICTLHQPSDSFVLDIDVVYIVSQGQCVYQGDPRRLVDFLADSGVPCEEFHSPLDYVIEIANNDYGVKVLETLLMASQNGKNYKYMPVMDTKHQIKTNNLMGRKPRNVLTKCCGDPFGDGWYEFRTMLRREMTTMKRDKFLTYLRIAGMLICCPMVGMVAYDIGGDVTKLFTNYNIILLHVAVVAICFSMMTCVAFIMNQKVVRNEYQNGYYSIATYFFSVVIMDLPITIGSAASGTFLLYWLTGQIMTIHRIFMFVMLSVSQAMVASSLGFFIGTCLNLNQGAFLIVAIHISIFVVSGFGISIHDMPKFFYYSSHFAYTRYVVRSQMGAIFGYNRPHIDCPEEIEYCHYQETAKFLTEMGLEDFCFWNDLSILIAFYLSIRLLSYLVIRYRLKNGIYVEAPSIL